MKRAWSIGKSANTQKNFLPKCHTKPHFFTPTKSPGQSFSRVQSPSRSLASIFRAFTDTLCDAAEDGFVGGDSGWRKISELRDRLVEIRGEDEGVGFAGVSVGDGVVRVLEEKRGLLLSRFGDNPALLELLKELRFYPGLALQVFCWRRKLADAGIPLTSEEYAKGISYAGRVKDINLAIELFTEAGSRRLKATSTYNALMGAYMYNGLSDKCQSVFRDLQRDTSCSASIVTYNILLSVFGRLMLVDHMEATVREIESLGMAPNVSTYNNLIAGYLTAWMWDDMERVFRLMEESLVRPDINTYLLMLRGYAHSKNLEKMEETYKLVKDHVDEKEIPLIRTMISAYCRSTLTDKVMKVEALLRLIPEKGYKPWLNILLIRLYAKELLLDKMEDSIDDAFEHHTYVHTAGIMRAIVDTYFRCGALDKLVQFVKRAENAGWRICRSLYHCKMVMLGSQRRIEEMEGVLEEMENFNMYCTKKTLVIMYKAYLMNGKNHKVEQLKGLMCKCGYGLPPDVALA
ncbi:hypothetical protein MLD38_028094 [Melastoma candidum]|uniref:Uncharacterized protein n=1 Tax=Melastoma candidum TaxID=119954 RepID=A0ACB9N493_9MYRT|nr:hypothetical protein MLD38_028094 [Melastoma candidum]